ncbi:MAG: hypothetical protein Q7K98_06785 [Candidatus Omnitrophota bacterium]|nr:hypothetical protein [Candidatus Omnitrophota bacterium]
MKKLLVLLLCLFVIGCEQKSVQTQTGAVEENLEIENMLNEDTELLAIKYGVDSNTLVGVISDYEELTKGFSLTKAKTNISKNVDKEQTATTKLQIMNIQTAIETVSNKYQISKEKIANILIDNKMMERCENE